MFEVVDNEEVLTSTVACLHDSVPAGPYGAAADIGIFGSFSVLGVI
jgi:hypothetical protein